MIDVKALRLALYTAKQWTETIDTNTDPEFLERNKAVLRDDLERIMDALRNVNDHIEG